MLNKLDLPNISTIKKIGKWAKNLSILMFAYVLIMLFFWGDGKFVIYSLPKPILDKLKFVLVLLASITGFFISAYFFLYGLKAGLINQEIQIGIDDEPVHGKEAKERGILGILLGCIILIGSLVLFYFFIRGLFIHYL